ncbi:MAG: hypothetical protein GY832_39080, partial [Chloroflexi bacterium]|nr:hypothetical protein [Chloroflexota bacterium]
RVLVSVEDIAAMQVREPFDYEVVLNHFDWVPGTHILAFNTRLQMQIGLSLNNDLHLVNADTLEYTALLPPGKGGEFHPSPDGRQIAVVTPGAISLVRIDGSDRREVFTYTPIVTYSEVRYYAQPVWAADSGSLRVAIPPVDPHVHPLPPTSVWHIRTDGSSARLLGNVQARQMMPSVISTDLQYIAHLDIEQPDLTLPPMVNLLITDLDNRETITYYPIDSTETFTQHPAATLIYGWSSDSQRLIFQGSLHDLATQALVGQIGGDVVPVYADTDFVMDVRWVDARRYLFLAQGSRGWSIVLGDIGGSVKGVASVAGDYPTFDFSSPPHDSTASGG